MQRRLRLGHTGRLVALFAASTLALAACGSSDDGSSSATSSSSAGGGGAPDGPIVIGSATARSGAFAPYDTGPATGLEVAVEQINRRGGILGRQVEIVYSDTESDPANGAKAALDVIEQGARLVVVSCDFDLGAPAASVAVEQGVLSASTCGASTKFNPDVLGRLLFTMSTGTPAEGEIMADWAHAVKRFRTAYVLEDPGFAYAKDLCSGFEGTFGRLDGAEIVGKDSFKSTDAKLSAQIGRIRESDPDFIFLCALTPAGPTAIKQIRAAGIDTPILSGAAMDGSYWTGSIPDLSEFYFDTYGSIFGDDPRRAVNAFVEAETTKTGEAPATSFDMTGYALGEAFALAAERAQSTDGEALADALEQFDGEELITGPTSFDATTHLNGVRPMAIIEVQDGKHRFLQMYPED